MPAFEREFAGRATAPATARHFARAALGGLLGEAALGVLGDDVELVVSELVTNAVRAKSPTVGVSLELSAVPDGRTVLVSVHDRAAGWPERRTPGIHDTGGRGLPLVDAISASWGVRLVEGGKTVWARLVVP